MASSVVTCKNLGLYGRLGNQLWQLAAVIGVARSAAATIRLPPWRYQSAFCVPQDWFGHDWAGASDVTERAGHLAPEVRDYLQDTSLWWNHRSEVRRFLSPSPAAISAAVSIYGELLDGKAAVTAMHVRRGDYLKHQDKFNILRPDFYRRARAELPQSRLIIFTDDPAWAAVNLRDLAPDMISPAPADFVDLAAMSMCDQHVTANSSFSWWGAFLSGSTSVLYPTDWYQAAFAHHMTSSMQPPDWVGFR